MIPYDPLEELKKKQEINYLLIPPSRVDQVTPPAPVPAIPPQASAVAQPAQPQGNEARYLLIPPTSGNQPSPEQAARDEAMRHMMDPAYLKAGMEGAISKDKKLTEATIAPAIHEAAQPLVHAVNSLAFGIPRAVLDRTAPGVSKDIFEPTTPVGKIGGGLGSLAGMITGPFKAVGAATGAAMKRWIPATVTGTFLKSMAANAATLAGANFLSEWRGQDVGEVLKNKAGAAWDGIKTGAIFGVTGSFALQKAPILSSIIRYGVNQVATDLADGRTPFGYDPSKGDTMLDLAYRVGLNMWFSRHGQSPAETLENRVALKRMVSEAKEWNAKLPADHQDLRVPDNEKEIIQALQESKTKGPQVPKYNPGIPPKTEDEAVNVVASSLGTPLTSGEDARIRSLIDTQAKYQGVAPDEYVQSKPIPNEITRDGQAVIRAFKGTTAGDLAREIGPVFRRGLAPDDFKILDTEYGVKDGQWNADHENRFAGTFDKYIETGTARTPALTNVMEKFKTWARNIWDGFRGQTAQDPNQPSGPTIQLMEKIWGETDPAKIQAVVEKPVRNENGEIIADPVNLSKTTSTPIGGPAQDLSAVPASKDVKLGDILYDNKSGEQWKVADTRDPALVYLENDRGTQRPAGRDIIPDAFRTNPMPQPGGPGGAAGKMLYTQKLPGWIGGLHIDCINSGRDAQSVMEDAASIAHEDMRNAVGPVRPWSEVEARARDLGLDVNEVMKKVQGKAYNLDSWLLAADGILSKSAEDVAAKFEKYRDSQETKDLVDYQIAMNRHLGVQTLVTGARSEMGRAFNILQKTYTAQNLRWNDRFTKALELLGDRVRDKEIMDKFSKIDLRNPVDIRNFLLKYSPPGGLYDIAKEAWLNLLLSRPTTHLRNFISNTLTLIGKPIEGTIAAAIEAPKALFGKERQIYFGESAKELQWLFKVGLKEGMRKAHYALVNEAREQDQSKLDTKHMPAIRGTAGALIRIPTRYLSAADEFFKGMLFTMDMAGQAYRSAAQKGLKGQAQVDHIADIMTNPQDYPDLAKHAKGEMLYRTFQAELGNIGKGVMNLRNQLKGMEFIVPFIKTPLNIFKFAAERTPYNFLRIVKMAKDGKLGKGALSTELSKMALGCGTAMTLAMLFKEGTITGGPPKDAAKRDEMMRAGWRPYSVRIGETYISYGNYEPISSIVGTTADFIDMMHKMSEGEKMSIAGKIAGSITKNFTSKTYLQGLSNFLDAVTDPEKSIEKLGQTLAGSLVPGFVAGVTQAIDPDIKEVNSALDAIRSRIPGIAAGVPTKRDVYGQKIQRYGGSGIGGALARFGSPSEVTSKAANVDPIDQVLMKLPYDIPKASRTIRNVSLTDQEYEQFNQSRGALIHDALGTLIQRPGFERLNDDQKQYDINRIVNAATERAGIMMLKTFPKERVMVPRKW